MNKMGKEPRSNKNPSIDESTQQNLLQRYLALSSAERSREFVDTAQTANLLGLSRRTVQLWVELGIVNAVSIGKKHFVFLDSLRKALEKKNEP